MTGLKILAGGILGLFHLGLVRLGAGVEYSGEGLFVRLRLGKFSFVVYPRKKKPGKEKTPKTSKTREEPPSQEPEGKRGGALEQVKAFLPLVCQAAGELRRKIRVDTLWLDLVMRGEDPAAAAMTYGYANMTMGMLWPLIEQNFEVRDPRISVRVEFDRGETTIHIKAALSLRLGQLISFSLRFGWKFLRTYLRTRPRVKSQKEAI